MRIPAPHSKLLLLGVLASLLGASCGGEVGDEEADDSAALQMFKNGKPLACADPGAVSEKGAEVSWFVFCTGMGHVWTTSDWKSFGDGEGSLKFDLAGMPAPSQKRSRWWAPAVYFDAKAQRYVMWVSVPDDGGAEDSRSLAVLVSPNPLGTWRFVRLGINGAKGQNHIDPHLSRNADGSHTLFWKRYGTGITSEIRGATLNGTLDRIVDGTQTKIMNGYGGNGTWEDNVRENPTVWQDPASGDWHLLFSGGHWDDASYATGHAVSRCGPLCTDPARGGWHITSANDRGVNQVMQSRGDPRFTHGGPGGAEWLGSSGHRVLFAAASGGKGDATRYLFRQYLYWKNGAPYVNNGKHLPKGF